MSNPTVLNDYIDGIFILKSLDDLNKIDKHTPFQRKCPICGRILFNKELYTYKKDKFKMECWVCLTKQAQTADVKIKRLSNYKKAVKHRRESNPDKYKYLNEPLELNKDNLILLYNLVNNSKLKYNCVSCGKEVIINNFRATRIDTYKRLLCHDCNASYYWKNISNQKRLDIRNKKQETSYRIYHLPAPPTIKYLYYGIYFDSKPELAIWIYCIDNNIPIIRTPCVLNFKYNNENLKYVPDFLIQGLGLVEIKGKHLVDEYGKWVNPFDKTKNGLYEAKHQCAIQNNVKILYEDDYTYYVNYIDNIYGRYHLDLFRINNPFNPSYFGLNGYRKRHYRLTDCDKKKVFYHELGHVVNGDCDLENAKKNKQEEFKSLSDLFKKEHKSTETGYKLMNMYETKPIRKKRFMDFNIIYHKAKKYIYK